MLCHITSHYITWPGKIALHNMQLCWRLPVRVMFGDMMVALLRLMSSA